MELTLLILRKVVVEGNLYVVLILFFSSLFFFWDKTDFLSPFGNDKNFFHWICSVFVCALYFTQMIGSYEMSIKMAVRKNWSLWSFLAIQCSFNLWITKIKFVCVCVVFAILSVSQMATPARLLIRCISNLNFAYLIGSIFYLCMKCFSYSHKLIDILHSYNIVVSIFKPQHRNTLPSFYENSRRKATQ